MNLKNSITLNKSKNEKRKREERFSNYKTTLVIFQEMKKFKEEKRLLQFGPTSISLQN